VKEGTLNLLPQVSDLDTLLEEDIATDCGIPLTPELKMYALDMLSEQSLFRIPLNKSRREMLGRCKEAYRSAFGCLAASRTSQSFEGARSGKSKPRSSGSRASGSGL